MNSVWKIRRIEEVYAHKMVKNELIYVISEQKLHNDAIKIIETIIRIDEMP